MLMNSKKLDSLLINVADMALKRRARKIVEEIDIQSGDYVLDAGCGDGYYIHLLYSMNPDAYFVGSDFDIKALESAERNFKGNKVPVKRLKPKKGEKIDTSKFKKGMVYLIFGDLMDALPFKSNTFNKVVLGEVAEHLPKDVQGLKELHRVIKKEGTLVVTVPNHNYPFLWDPVNWVTEKTTKRHVKDGFFAGLWYGHIRLYTRSQITSVVKEAGFSVEKSESMTYWCIPFNHHVVNLGARMLYGGKLSPKVVASVSKYKKKTKKPIYLSVFFNTVNIIDKLNDRFAHNNNGVGVLVKAKK